MPRTVPLLLFPAILTALVAATCFLGRARALDPPDDPTLEAMLRTAPREGERVMAAMELGTRREGQVALEEATGDRRPRVRAAAVQALVGRLREDLLLDALRDQDPRVRLEGLGAVAERPAERTRQEVQRIADADTETQLREIARRVLKR